MSKYKVDVNRGSGLADAAPSRAGNEARPTQDFVTTAATIGVIAAGVAFFEVALIPGMVIGGAAVLAPKLAPRRLPNLRRRLQPQFNSTFRRRIMPASPCRIGRTLRLRWPPVPGSQLNRRWPRLSPFGPSSRRWTSPGTTW